MASILVCNRINTSKSKRIKIENVGVDENVSILRGKIAESLDESPSAIELLYGGQILKDDESLTNYNITPGVTVHAIAKVLPTPDQDPAFFCYNATRCQSLKQLFVIDVIEPMNPVAIQHVVTALQSALINPAYRNTVERMLSDPETLQNLITATPGLDKDPIALAMIQDPELLAMLADPKLINSVIKSHPSLGHAANFLAASVSEDAARGATSSGPRPSTRGHYYSMDQMSDDDEEMETGLRMATNPNSSQTPITANQLGAALAALTGAGMSIPGGGGGSTGSGSTGASAMGGEEGVGGISSDFFRQAMVAASSNPGTSSSQQPRPITENDLQQLREMGITDDTVARQALEATGGNIQAALEIIFGDGLE